MIHSTYIHLLCSPKSIAHGLALARSGRADGADGVCFELTFLPPEERTVENFRALVAAAGVPTIFCDYRKDAFRGADDEARMADLLLAADAGADYIDVMGDLYEPSQFELAMSDAAVAKQVRTIEEVHRRGAKVVMSSHVLDRARTADEVIAHLREQEKRGADICKHVSMVNTADEFQESVKTLCRLRAEFKKPWIVLGSGAYGRMQRFLGPQFGCAVEFAVHDYEPGDPYDQQPTIRAFKSALDAICWRAPA